MSLTETRKPAVARPAATRAQLIEAATAEFTEVGYHSATIREICQRAGANIAAVHYHFGDKEALYSEVLSEAYRRALEQFPIDPGLPRDATPERRLGAFIRAFLQRIFSDDRNASHGKLMAREMVAPTAALDRVVDEWVRPQAGVLFRIVRDLLGAGFTDRHLHLAAMSIVSQALFYNHCRPVIRRLFPDLKLDATAIDDLATHITAFSLAALKHLPRPSRRKS
jgi:AcrR family transcriptional regulator